MLNAEVKIDPTLPKIGKELLRKVMSKEITMQEFDVECAHWLLDTIKDMVWKPMPSAPIEVREYVENKRKDKDYKVSQEFWHIPSVQSYFAQVSAVGSCNRSNTQWLQFMSKNIDKKNIPAHEKINNLLEKYRICG